MDNPVTQASLPAERFDLRHPCHTQGRELAVIGKTNEKPSTNIILKQPTILIISNFPKESAFSKSKTFRASHDWEAVNNHKLESGLLGEISVTSDMQMTAPLWQKVKRN